jgi:hypothetical protein
MNKIKKSPASELGFDFIPEPFLPKGKDEYYLREQQNKSKIKYRPLKEAEINVLIQYQNISDDWNNILVSDPFSPELIKNCSFFGLVRIGKLEPWYLEFHSIRMKVGLYNSTIISCDLGDNVVVENVHYLSHYIIGNEVVLCNIEEMGTTNYAKFGNGVLKDGEDESVRVKLEVCNENAGRSIIPYDGMLPGDAWLWSRYRDRTAFQQGLKAITEREFDSRRGYYGEVGDRTVIKSCKIIKDVWVGTDAYLKGANKLKNLTIRSSANASTQIGEGCELVNGIIEEKCRVFYGVKAVRFYMASNSQLKYGARLINSYLGNNATISCCEVLNSLIFPAHEQHHNNSFLCAAMVMGQSNIAAGATLGSNHNSRSADGELIAGRGFWPALCVSIKHNSKFATYTLLAKGDYPAELNIPFPFSLVSNDEQHNRLVIMPGYWFMYNMYALARNAGKYIDRDKRLTKDQHIEYHYLAPDSINEIFDSLKLMEEAVGRAAYKKENAAFVSDEKACIRKGKSLLQNNDASIDKLEILVSGIENTNRPVILVKVRQAYQTFQDLIYCYITEEVFSFLNDDKIKSPLKRKNSIRVTGKRKEWVNMGGQLVEQTELQKLINKIETNKIKNWNQVHQFYQEQASFYTERKRAHALICWKEISGKTNFTNEEIRLLFNRFIHTKEWMLKGIESSREKDYTNPFRKMVYTNDVEMETITGKLSENTFILKQKAELKKIKREVKKWIDLL